MSDFLELARKVQARGMSVSEAVAKFKSALNRAGAPKKKAPKKPIRIVKDGIRIYPDGHERCLTGAARQKRWDEVYARDVVGNDTLNVFYLCANCKTPGFRHQFEVDHIRKRSVGRDDRLANLQLLCNGQLKNCHNKKHDEFRK